MKAAGIARAELRGGLKGFRLFLACLALGVAAIAAVGLVRASIQAGLAREGAALLGGDAAVELTYRFATDPERVWMDSVADRISETVDFRSMAVAGEDRALTQVRAVDDAYPLIGAVTLDPAMPLDQAFAGADGLPGGVMERPLADRLALRAGDRFTLGRQEFVLSAVLVQYPDNSAAGFGLGPRTLVLTRDLDDAGLIAPGTLYSTDYRLDLHAGADLAQLAGEAETALPGARWRDARAGAPGVAEFVDRLGAFLILVGLSGLAVGGVGIAAAVHSYLAGKIETIATLKTLGASRGLIFRVYGLQIAALTGLGVAIGLALAVLGVAGIAPVLSERLPVPAVFRPWPAPLAEAALYGALTALIFTLWPLSRAAQTRGAALFRPGAPRRWPGPGVLAGLTVAVALLVGAAAALSGSARLTLWTFAGLGGALVALALAAQGVRGLAGVLRARVRARPGLRAALAAISARGGETTSVIVSLGLGLTVLAAVGQIDGTLQRAIRADLPDVAPSYFFVDIQPDQIAGFKERLADDPSVARVQAAPMLRGVITKINGAAPTLDHWVLQGDRGVTYSDTLPEDTTLTEGAWWPVGYDGDPLVSFSADEGAELGLKIGDSLTVNILGRDITARIASFRKVEFSTAGIGFVMSMNPGALRGAPHSWIATVYANEEAEAQILRDLSKAYPNITAISIREGVARVSALLEGIAAAIRWAAAVSLATGALVLIGAGLAGARARVFEAAVLKTLGATRGRVLASLAMRAGILGLAAGLVALTAGIAGGWAVSHFVMDVPFSVNWLNAVLVITIGVSGAVLAGLGFAAGPLAVRPARVLRARE